MPGRAGVDVRAELAYHWSNATRPVEVAKAVSYGLQAGKAALEALAPDEALRHFSQALALLQDETNADPHLQVDLLLGLGNAQRQAGSSEYRETFLDAARRARDLSDTDRLVSAALGNNRGMVSSAFGIDTERISVLEAALASLPLGQPGGRGPPRHPLHRADLRQPPEPARRARRPGDVHGTKDRGPPRPSSSLRIACRRNFGSLAARAAASRLHRVAGARGVAR